MTTIRFTLAFGFASPQVLVNHYYARQRLLGLHERQVISFPSPRSSFDSGSLQRRHCYVWRRADRETQGLDSHDRDKGDSHDHHMRLPSFAGLIRPETQGNTRIFSTSEASEPKHLRNHTVGFSHCSPLKNWDTSDSMATRSVPWEDFILIFK